MMLVIFARKSRQVFWPLHRQFRDDGIEVIVDRRHQERRRETGTSTVDRRYGDRRETPIGDHLRDYGWALLGEDVRRRARVAWILNRVAMPYPGR